MSLTSYRAAPPRVHSIHLGPRRSLPRTTIRGGGVVRLRLATLAGLTTVMSLTSYRAAPPPVNPFIWASAGVYPGPPSGAGASFGFRLVALALLTLLSA